MRLQRAGQGDDPGEMILGRHGADGARLHGGVQTLAAKRFETDKRTGVLALILIGNSNR